MATPRLIVGLGNPTAEHENDRHNAGFWFLEALARHHGEALKRDAKFFGNTGRLRIGIGHPRDFHQSGKPVVDYVLDRPSREHKRQIDESIERAIDAMPLVLKDDWPEAMKQLHTVASTD